MGEGEEGKDGEGKGGAAEEGVIREHRLRVDRSGAGERLDTYIARRVSFLTRSRVKRLAEEGGVFVDGKPVRANTRLKTGQEILIRVRLRRRQLKAWELPVEILYEDDFLLALNKPAGVVVHPAETLDEPTLVEALIALRPEIRNVGEATRPGLVHRLDKGTSGVLLVAKERDFQLEMMRLFQSHRVQKYYLALVTGVPRHRRGIIDACIVRHPVYRQRFTVSDEGGRRSITRWRLIRSYGDRFSLILANPLTGRTHQVRVHMRYLGTPILCDELYSSRQVIYQSDVIGGRRVKDERPLLARQALHARSIAFVHPILNRPIRIKAPLPDDIKKVLNLLTRSFTS